MKKLSNNSKKSSAMVNQKAKTDVTEKDVGSTNKTMWIIFGSLLLDLLAFTMILPLLPSLLDHYKVSDGPNGTYEWLESKIQYFQKLTGTPDRFNSVLFGGYLGSMFSLLQFLTSPLIGGLSDVYGRKVILLLCLGGICGSYVLWVFSWNFLVFILARIAGGISKGNIGLSMAVIADVSSVKSRGKGMALVGIAFSIGFILGPLIGAVFAKWSEGRTGDWFMIPAMFALVLATTDFFFILLFFKETLPKEKRAKSLANSLSQAAEYINIKAIFKFQAVKNIDKKDLRCLQILGTIYFVYLLIYSGLEFTLTFLTHHTFHYSSMEQGWMFFGIGLIMAILQGSWVRRLPEDRIKPVATLGLLLIIPSFIFIGLAREPIILFLGLFFFAVSTAMVVSCMTTLASKFGPENQKGTVLGIFRSLGALARAIGPVFASIAFWSIGSTLTYTIGGIALIWPWYALRSSSIK